MDIAWMSSGGMLLDGTGDIAFTTSDFTDVLSMIATRLKADLGAWQSYPTIGANLKSLLGNVASQEINASAQKLISTSLTNQFLSQGDFVVKTILVGKLLNIYVYERITSALILSTTVSL
jgi:hypothetical protein